MTTVEQIQAEATAFKAAVVDAVDSFVIRHEISERDAEAFLAEVGIERPEAPEVRQAREELAALKATVRAAIESRTDGYRRTAALEAMGL